MESIFFLKGLIIGIAITAPPGPIGILCIRKTLAEGHPRGFIIGLGAATADTMYSAVAAFGLTFISDVIVSQYLWIRILGGGLLLYLGIRMLHGRHKAAPVPLRKNDQTGSYLSALALALTNPMTVFAFATLFALFGTGKELGVTSAGFLVLGVFAGSCLWFFTLGYVAELFGRKLSSDGLRWVHRLAGLLVICSGVAAFVSIAYAGFPGP